jgi:hypothetical protein
MPEIFSFLLKISYFFSMLLFFQRCCLTRKVEQNKNITNRLKREQKKGEKYKEKRIEKRQTRRKNKK